MTYHRPPTSRFNDRILIDRDGRLRWLQSRRGRAQLTKWAAEHRALVGWDPTELISPIGSPRVDSMQAALVAVAQRGEDRGEGDAALLLLAQLTPGLNRLCRWTVAAGFWPWPDAVPEVRAAFFETLYRHRLERRPSRIAANLILDTRQRLDRANRSQAADTADHNATEHVTTIDRHWPHTPAGDVAGQLTAGLALRETVRAAVENLPGSARSRSTSAELAYRVWFLDQPRAQAAAELGIATTNATVRLHRLRQAIDRSQLAG